MIGCNIAVYLVVSWGAKIMIKEYSEYLRNAAALTQKYEDCFSGIHFDEHTQAIEVFVLQALNMCSSHCNASALLLQNDYVGETATVLRSIQELLFDINWILEPKDRKECLERVYQLEADPYNHLAKETEFIGKQISPSVRDKMREQIDNIAKKYPYLLINNESSKTFKKAPPFASRMGEPLRAKYYHLYSYSSLFAHPTPFTKSLYLKTCNSTESLTTAFEDSHKQLVAYSLLFVEMIIGFVEETLGTFSESNNAQRKILYAKMKELVKRANKNYFQMDSARADL